VPAVSASGVFRMGRKVSMGVSIFSGR
jgi:hypothetical protein